MKKDHSVEHQKWYSKKITTVVLSLFFLAVSALFLTSPGRAQSVPKPQGNSNQEIGKVRNQDSLIVKINSMEFQSAAVIFIPRNVATASAISPAELEREGCEFRSADPKRISNLISILNKAKINSEYSGKLLPYEAREGAYLTAKNGMTFKFVFGYEFTNVDLVYGMAATEYQGVITRKPRLTANHTIVTELLGWTTGLNAEPHTVFNCKEI